MYKHLIYACIIHIDIHAYMKMYICLCILTYAYILYETNPLAQGGYISNPPLCLKPQTVPNPTHTMLFSYICVTIIKFNL